MRTPGYAAIVFAIFVAGCGPSRQASPPGGIIGLEWIEGAFDNKFAYAVFIANVPDGGTPYSGVGSPSDTCEVPASAGAVLEEKFVGEPVVLTNGSNKVFITRNSGGAYYGDVAVVAFDAAYDVVVPGTTGVGGANWPRSLLLPKRMVLVEPDPAVSPLVVPTSGAWTVAWQPAGADAVVLVLFSDSGTRVCVLEDDGTFTVPVEVADSMGTSGQFLISAVRETRRELDGREVILKGATGYADYFQRL